MIETILKIIFNSLISGLLLSLVALGFAYIFSITKVFHLAHGGIFVVGGMLFWWLTSQGKIGLFQQFWLPPLF